MAKEVGVGEQMRGRWVAQERAQPVYDSPAIGGHPGPCRIQLLHEVLPLRARRQPLPHCLVGARRLAALLAVAVIAWAGRDNLARGHAKAMCTTKLSRLQLEQEATLSRCVGALRVAFLGALALIVVLAELVEPTSLRGLTGLHVRKPTASTQE